jgi:hypothetical protein
MQTIVLNLLLVAHHFFMQFANIIIFEIESTTMRSQANDIVLLLCLDKREITIYDLIFFKFTTTNIVAIKRQVQNCKISPFNQPQLKQLTKLLVTISLEILFLSFLMELMLSFRMKKS